MTGKHFTLINVPGVHSNLNEHWDKTPDFVIREDEALSN